mmetsp:Transcript_48379/g.135139  ORF Transcript_48379/g.135139 Transcript_48379/m.135139 type:complete len:207 (+) Transcript_48379:562-1182(+)
MLSLAKALRAKQPCNCTSSSRFSSAMAQRTAPAAPHDRSSEAASAPPASASSAKNSQPRSWNKPSDPAAAGSRNALATATGAPAAQTRDTPEGQLPVKSAESATTPLARSFSAASLPGAPNASVDSTSTSADPAPTTALWASGKPCAINAKTTAPWLSKVLSLWWLRIAATTASGPPARQRASCCAGPCSKIMRSDRKPRICASPS